MTFTSKGYGHFMGAMLAAFYAFSVQGRPQAFYKLSYAQFMKFWERGETIYSRFLKTAASCHFQVRRCCIGELLNEYSCIVCS